ncbi:DNA polymerase IV [Diaporthe eres]|uniref:DNA polymerase lambda n=1 Tax=Diaporthe vaccinii TaxID=105482 RepID=A0ABR4EQ83_9PEZI|nr:DNA polymerase IV [Diaporthe eres]
MSADVPLTDKEAFYSQLGWLDATSGSEDEASLEDRKLRDKNRGFFQQALSKDKTTTTSRKPTTDPVSTADESQTRVSRRSNTAPKPLSARSTGTIIKGTPGGLDSSSKQANRQHLTVSTSFVEDTPRQEPLSSAVAKLRRSATNPSSLSSNTSFSEPIPGSTMGSRKRKHEAGIPLSDQILGGLRFFYIPGDRKNPVRRRRMEHAEKYGAVVISVLTDATHVIVDDNLTFEHINDMVAPGINHNQPLIVREHWPLHSIEEKRLLPTTSSWYRVVPPPKTTDLSTPAASTTDEPARESLEVKAARNDPNRQDHDPHRTPSQSEKSSAPQYGSHSEVGTGTNAAHVTIPSSQPSSGDGASRAGHNSNRPASHDYGDELSVLIEVVQKNYKDLPSIEGDDDKESDDKNSDDTSQSESEGKKPAKRPKKSKASKPKVEDNFLCSRGGTIDKSGGPNARTIEVLQQLLDYYIDTNDHFRIIAYRRGINTLSMQPEKVTTAEEAILLPFIGGRLSSKIEEIVNTDRLQRLDHLQNDPTSKILRLFLGIYGVGRSIANQWVAKGFRTLNDLRQHAPLTPNQRVGIEHYQDLNTRIPRAEVKALADYVKDEAARIDKDVELLIGGSYRRGADTSGDIDFIITKAGTKSSEELIPFLDLLVYNLTKKGFLTAELASHNSRGSNRQEDGDGSKWHGCCVLPPVAGLEGDNDGYRPWRRIDLLLVPETEYGAALIYFTGNDIFNRSIRLLASRKSMRLNQRGLYKDVIRGSKREKLTEGELVEGKSEKRIFEILGVQWREPHERWC